MAEPIMTFSVNNGSRIRVFGCFCCSVCGEEFRRRVGKGVSQSGLCIKCANKQAGIKRSTHGFSNKNSRLHVTWANMKRRCLNPRGREVFKYKGVTLCDEWHEFEPFMQWSLANGYTDKMTIDRKDPYKGYSPDNCRYVGYGVQSANRKITNKNKSGHVGISFDRGKWVAKVTWDGKQIYLGRHATKDAAVHARNEYLDANSLPHTRS